MTEPARYRYYSLEKVKSMLQAAVDRAGNASRYARQIGISSTHVNDVLHSKRSPGEAILGPLGLEKVTLYVQQRKN